MACDDVLAMSLALVPGRLRTVGVNPGIEIETCSQGLSTVDTYLAVFDCLAGIVGLELVDDAFEFACKPFVELKARNLYGIRADFIGFERERALS